MPCKRLARDLGNLCRRLPAVAGVLCLIAVLFIPHPSYAQGKILGAAALTDSTVNLELGRYAITQKDPEEKITPASIVASNGTILSGTQTPNDMVFLGFDGVKTWLSVKLLNQSKQSDWVIDLGKRAEGRIGLLKEVHGYEMTVSETGAVSVNELPSQGSSSLYKIRLAPNEQKLILFEMKAGAGLPTVVPLKIYSEEAFLEHTQAHSTLHTFYCLLLLGFALYFLNFALVRKRKSLLVYGGYFAYLAMVWMILDAVGPFVGSSILAPFILCSMLSFSLLSVYMTKVFCGIEFGSFTEKYILYGLAWLNIASTLLSFILPVGSGIAHISMLYGAPVITMIIIGLMSFAQSRNGQLPSNMYFYSWLLPLAGYVVTSLSACNIIPNNFYALTAFWIAIPVQGYFLIRAVSERMSTMGELEIGGHRTVAHDGLHLNKLKETKDTADHTRLLKVIEKEREMLAEFRAKEASRTEEMRKAKEIADEANRAKSAFLAVVSHEIRTPMTGVMGMVRLLLDTNINKQQKDFALAIQESSEAMLALLNDILDFEKIQRGKIELENISFDLHRLIQGVVTLMSGHATEKGIGLSARMSDDLPKFVKGDPTRLRQVLLNLMGNAIKFTEKGSVTLYVKNLNPESDTSGGNEKHMVYFAVQDTGIGITPDAQKSLFSPFSQANSSISRKFGGTGLGLAISKGLIENMKSSVNINSKEGEGSTFFFTLEMDRGLAISQEQRKSASDSAATTPAQPIKILVVDDNSITRKVVTGFLESGGHEIVGVNNADEALTRIKRDAFDLILMDIELPGMKGNEATRILREHPDPVKSKLPVIAMTGNVNVEDRERYLADGMNGFVAKPIDPEKLRAIVAEISRKTFEREIKAPTLAPLPPIPAPAPEQKAPLANMEGIFNPEMLQSLKDTIGANSLSELLHDLIIKTEEILVQMDDATKIGDWEGLAARAHELKGMAGNFGLVEISSIAALAEKKAKSNERDGLNSLIGSLPDANVRAQDALRDWVSH